MLPIVRFPPPVPNCAVRLLRWTCISPNRLVWIDRLFRNCARSLPVRPVNVRGVNWLRTIGAFPPEKSRRRENVFDRIVMRGDGANIRLPPERKPPELEWMAGLEKCDAEPVVLALPPLPRWPLPA